MNNFWKVLISIIGATDIVFKIVTPIFISLLLVIVIDFNQNWHSTVLIIVGLISALYRVVDVTFLRG